MIAVPDAPRERVSTERIEAFLDQYGVALIAFARSMSSSAVDADDVYQRMLEAMLRTRPSVECDRQLYGWATRVISNEVISDHRARMRRPEVEFDEAFLTESSAFPDPPALLTEKEQFSSLGEALRRLRPDHARCLILRAEGFDYPKISDLTGFSYSKVNRCLSEGREALRTQFGRIDEGKDCARLRGALSAFADDSISSSSREDVELHLKNCMACQAVLREYRDSPRRTAFAFPIGSAALGSEGVQQRIQSWVQKLVDVSQSAITSVQEQVALRTASVYQGAELATAKNAAIAVGITASIAAGTAGVATVVSDGKNDTPSTANTPAQSEKQPAAPIVRPDGERAGDDADRAKKQEPSGAPREATAADVETPGYGRQTQAEAPRSQPSSGNSAPIDPPASDLGGEPQGDYSGPEDSPSGLEP